MQTRRTLLAASVALAASPALAQPASTVKVALTTAEGVVVLELEQAKAPVTVGNFLKYVDRKLYDGAAFYRASTPPGGPKTFGLLQGGLQNDPKKVLPPIAQNGGLKRAVRTPTSGLCGANWLAKTAIKAMVARIPIGIRGTSPSLIARTAAKRGVRGDGSRMTSAGVLMASALQPDARIDHGI